MIGVPTPPISVASYQRMIDAGILGEDDPYELLFGHLVEKMPKNRPHSYANTTFRDAIAKVLQAGYFVEAQEPVTLATSEPEPDLKIVRGDAKAFRTVKPKAADTALVAEVSDSSLGRDRGLKQAVYADAAIPVYWVIDVNRKRVEVFTEPLGTGETAVYTRCEAFEADQSVPVLLDGRAVASIPLADLFA